MRISLIDRALPTAVSTYDAYHNFYCSSADASPLGQPRDDYRIYIHDKQGETLDVICNAEGLVSSIAFRQQAVKTAASASFDILNEGGPLAVIADPTVEAYYVELIRCAQFNSSDLNKAILMSSANCLGDHASGHDCGATISARNSGIMSPFEWESKCLIMLF